MGLRRNCLIWPVLLLLLVGAVLTALLPPVEDQGGHSVLGILRRETLHKEDPALGHRSDSTEEQRFTIIIQTYNRTDILLRLLNHYQAVPHLWKIIIVWNNVGEQTPLKLWNSLGPHPVPVVFKEQTSNQMRNRLQPFPEIDTDGQFIWVFLFLVCFCLWWLTFHLLFSCTDAGWWHPGQCSWCQLCFFCLEGKRSCDNVDNYVSKASWGTFICIIHNTIVNESVYLLLHSNFLTRL